jgi:hypothetical protein
MPYSQFGGFVDILLINQWHITGEDGILKIEKITFTK